MRIPRVLILVLSMALLGAACSGTSNPATAAPTQQAAVPAATEAPTQEPAAPAATAAPTPGQPGAVSFASPEDAINQYLAGFSKGDVAAILQSCAIDEKAAGFHFDLYVDRLRAMMLLQSLAPADYPFYGEINKAGETAQVLGRVKVLAYSLLSDEKLDGSVIAGADKAKADAFIAAVDPGKLSGLKVEMIQFPKASFKDNASYLKNAAAIAAIYGADESTERLALFSLDGKYYYVGFTLLRYGSGWKVSEQTAPLGNSSATGAAEPTTVQDFEALVGK